MNFKHQFLAVVICLAIVLLQPLMTMALNAREISEIARDVTVKVISKYEKSKSGIIFERQDNVYSVITTAFSGLHFFLQDEVLFEIKTSDGETYPVASQQKLPGIDLAILTFESPYEYAIAELGNSDEVLPLQTIFVSGFPTIQNDLDLVSGQVRSIREDVLINPEENRGYAFFYSNQTLPGSSGGAVIDEQGDLIAVNGETARDPITGRDISRGIPVNTFLSVLEENERSNISEEDKRLILEDRLFANSGNQLPLNESAENITVKVTGHSNGSGVIFMREGNLYSVVTNQHVTPVETDYQIRTYEGSNHQVVNRQEIPGMDLAIIQFESSEDYFAASLGDSNELERLQQVYVAGFPGEQTDLTLVPGGITTIRQDILQNPSLEKGYALNYDNNTFAGTSGGAILDEDGILMGINGEADFDGATGRTISRGIPVNLFIDAWIELNLNSN